MKLFLAAILSLFLFNVNACEIIDNSFANEIGFQIQDNSNDVSNQDIISNGSWHSFHEHVMEIEEEEEIHKVKMVLSTLFTFYFKFELDSTINTFENFYFSKEITPVLPRYVIFEVFRI